MLVKVLEKAVSLGGSSVEIEYRDGKEYITVFRGDIGYGIACLDSKDAKPLFKEMDVLRKEKRVVLCGSPYRLAFSRYESFGEWVHQIQIKEVGGGASPKHRRRRCPS